MAERLDIESMEDEISKSQLKRDQHALVNMGKKLVALAETELEHIPMSERCLDLVMAAKTMSRTALKRQLGYLGGMLNHEDTTAITTALDVLRRQQQMQVGKFHEIEKWRDSLIAGDHATMDTISGKHPDLDRQHIQQLVRQAIKEKQAEKPPKSARALFQYLVGLQQVT